MKAKSAFIIIVLLCIIISGCNNKVTGNIKNQESLPVSETAQVGESITIPENSPVISPSMSPEGIEQNTILPLEKPWYDWKTEGVNSLNLIFGGYLTGDDKYLYFVPDYNNDDATDKLYKANLDGSVRTLLDTDCKGNLIIEGNILYYLKNNGIYSINTDTLKKTEIIKGSINCFYIYNKSIYIMTEQKKLEISDDSYKIKKIDVVQYATQWSFSDKFLYYLDNSGGGDCASLYQYDLYNNEKKKIMESISCVPIIYDGVLYYWNDSDNCIETYDINKQRSKILYNSETGLPSLMSYYNQYLINCSEDCVFDTRNGNSFSFKDMDINAIYSTPVAAYALLEDGWYRLDIHDKKLTIKPLND